MGSAWAILKDNGGAQVGKQTKEEEETSCLIPGRGAGAALHLTATRLAC